MYLIHSKAPYKGRGQSLGKVLVHKTVKQCNQEEYKAVGVCSYIKAGASRSEEWKETIKH
jgi:predicted GNAT family acetyltransferase